MFCVLWHLLTGLFKFHIWSILQCADLMNKINLVPGPFVATNQIDSFFFFFNWQVFVNLDLIKQELLTHFHCDWLQIRVWKQIPPVV